MKVSRARDRRDQEEQADSSIDRRAHGQVHERLTKRTQEGQRIAHEVELSRLIRPRENPPRIASQRMQRHVEPAPNRVIGRVLPCLQPVSVREVVRRLPVVEGFVAVLDWGEASGDEIRGEEDEEGLDGCDGVDARASGGRGRSAGRGVEVEVGGDGLALRVESFGVVEFALTWRLGRRRHREGLERVAAWVSDDWVKVKSRSRKWHLPTFGVVELPLSRSVSTSVTTSLAVLNCASPIGVVSEPYPSPASWR